MALDAISTTAIDRKQQRIGFSKKVVSRGVTICVKTTTNHLNKEAIKPFIAKRLILLILAGLFGIG